MAHAMCRTRLDPSSVTSPSKDQGTQEDHTSNDAKERGEIMRVGVHKRDRHVHPEYTTDEVEGHEDRSKEGNLAKHAVGVCPLRDTVDGERGQVIAVRARQDLLEMTQVGCHSHDVILDITKIHSDVHAWSDLVIFVATLGETTEHVCFASQKS